MRRSPPLVRRGAVALLALLGAACSAPGQSASPHAAIVAPPASARAPAEVSQPARWIYTDRLGVSFDRSLPAPTLLRSEPAILDGARVLVTGGILDGWARSEERFLGFQSLPERFGGGYAIWSDARTYRADTFLGELTVLADVGASGGVRPWLDALLLRTSAGNLLVDPRTHARRRADAPGIADAVAFDDRRGVRLDLLGRARVTADGGATWTDVLASRGARIASLEERESGVLLASPGRPEPALLFDRQGHLVEAKGPPRTPARLPGLGAAELGELARPSRSLASEDIANAAVLGARLPGARLLVAREGGLQILAEATALPLEDADLLDVEDTLSRCQPISSASSPVLLACAGQRGAEVLSLSSPLGRSRLEMTFPEESTFVAGPRSRLGFSGRCGPFPPSPDDLGASSRPSEAPDDTQADLSQESRPTPSPEPTSRVEPSLADDARYCARISADRWVERRLGGDDARSLYRFVPGDEGRVTALVFTSKPDPDQTSSPAPQGSSIGEGVRVIHLDPDDPALAGAAFPATPPAMKAAPFRTIDANFWEDEGGSIRGWVRLPPLGGSLSLSPIPDGAAQRKLRVAPGDQGRFAGVRLDPRGQIQLLPLPEGVTDVVFGGRFALAQGMKEGALATWETVDGGLTWTPIQGPPIGSLEAPHDGSAPVGCSAVGCAWGAGVVRLGWGSAPPRPETWASTSASAVLHEPPLVKLTCALDAGIKSWMAAPIREEARRELLSPLLPAKPTVATRSPTKRVSAARPPDRSSPQGAPISLRLGASALIGQLGAGGSFRGDVWPPFQPAAAVRHLAVTDHSLSTTRGGVIPLLMASPSAPVELLLSVGTRRLRADAATPAFQPFDIPAKITVAASGPDGELILLDSDKGVVWLARGDAVSAALRLGRVADVSSTRFTLGRRVAGGAVVLVGYSITTGEVFVGDLDLARGEVGPLAALGRIETLTDAGAPACSGQTGAVRFLADVMIDLKLAAKAGSAPLHEQTSLATFLIEASATRLCAAGVEIGFPQGKPADLTARFARSGGAAAVRTTTQSFKGTCALWRPTTE